MKKVLIILAIVLVVLFVAALFMVKAMSGFSGKVASVNKPSVLVVDLSQEYPERGSFDFSGYTFKRQTNFLSLIRAVEAAAEDDNILAMSLKADGVGLSRTQIEELSKAVKAFRESGKTVYSFLSGASMGGLLAASMADSVYMPPTGDFMLLGMAIMPMFFSGAAEKIGIGFDVIQIGDYKGAAEMFTEKGFTAPLRENYTSILDALYADWLSTVSQGCGIPAEKLEEAVNTGVFSAKEGLEMGLIDGILYPQEYRAKILALVDDKDDRIVSVSKYSSAKRADSGKRKIAVVYCLGNIHAGPSQNNPFRNNYSIGDETFIEAIDKAAKDETVEAILLRVDSPGGSALASDFIWKSIVDAKEKKPVVVSMGGVAASGGYYISMPADSIFCDANTITGSIGVIFMKFHAEQLMEKLGVTVDTVIRGSLADDFSIHKGMDADAYEAFRKSTEGIYNIFTSKAAEGRGLELDSLLNLAGGRIWTGRQAVDNHLADRVASFSEAIEATAKMASIPMNELGIVTYPKEKSWIEFAFEVNSGSASRSNSLLDKLEITLQPYIDAVSMFRSGEPLMLLPVKVDCGD